ncbi:VanW family protein [Saccharopolyspora sp.]|uniref:VanW family protein n=1 Tax=Saccharopolyspora sp. TaxID=33915 RepID=UPI0025F4C5B1|nr:VanW family protein [Saccharopolyspora sp.]
MPENYDVPPDDDPHRGSDRPGPAEKESGSGDTTGTDREATSPESAGERTTRISAGRLAAEQSGQADQSGRTGQTGTAEADHADSAQAPPTGSTTAESQHGQLAGELTEQGTRPISQSGAQSEGTERIDGTGTTAASGASGEQPPESDAERTATIPPVPGTEPAAATEQTYASPTDFIGIIGGSSQQQTARFPEHDTERTDTIPRVQPQEQPTWSFAGGVGGFSADPPEGPKPRPQNRSRLVRAGIGAGIAVGALALLYLGDLFFSSGSVPRGTTVADVQIGGMSKTAAERKLKNQLEAGLHEPIRLTTGETQASLSPDDAGLRMDWGETVERAGSQPLNPITRITSLFTEREITPASSADRAQVRQALEQVKPQLDRAPAEGTIRFEGATPVPVDPVTGRTVDLSSATDVVLSKWAINGPVRIPYSEQPVTTTKEGVQKALREVAQPAVSGPVTVRGEGHDAAISPETIAASLRFEPDGDGGLRAGVDVPAVVGGVEPQLRDTIKPGQDAQIVLEGGKPVVRPSVEGRGVDWNKSFEKLLDIYKKRDGRSVQAIYQQQPPPFTTEQANGLGIREVISEFETGGFEPASGANIRRVAEQVNGAVIKPGETFSLNGHTGPRGVPQGYVESGIIEDGRPAKAVGGGISQFATTLYNASYFAGVKDVEHKEHSYYISRYPPGREATVFQNPDGSSVIDVKFKNTLNSGVMITTQWTPSSIKIQFWGTKQYDVTSQTGPRTDEKPPHEKVVPPGQPCSTSKGTGGFTVTDTRTLRDVKTGKVTTEKPSKTVYNPQPIIHCGPSPPKP